MPEEAVQTTAAEAPSGSVQEPSGGNDVYHHKVGSENGAPPQSERAASGAQHSESDGAKAGQKPESLYTRTKKTLAEIKRREAAIQQRETQFAQREQAAAEAAKPKRDYTVAELKKYRGEWEREGKFDLVDAADKEIAAMEGEAQAERKARTIEMPASGSPEFRNEWEQAEAELFQADPEFMRAGTRLDTALRAIMAGPDGNIYRQHPRGIVAAYHRARMELLSAENSQLKNELKRYQGYTSVGAGAPARVGSGSRVESVGDFEKLSTKDMRKHLLANADKHGVPWF